MYQKPVRMHESNFDLHEIEVTKERPLIDATKLGPIIMRKRSIVYGSRDRFAYAIGLQPNTVQNIERRITYNAHILNLDKIARGLGMKLSELIALAED